MRRRRPLDLRPGVLVLGSARSSGRTVPPACSPADSPELAAMLPPASASRMRVLHASVDAPGTMHGHGAGEPEPEAEAEPVVAEGCGSVGSGGEDEALHRPTTPAVDGSMDEHNSIEEGAGREAGAGARLLPSHEDGLTGQSLEEWSKEDFEREMAEGTRPFIEELTPFSFLYEPHTVTALTFALIGLCYVAFFHPDGTFEDSIKLGLMMVASVFLVYCVTQLRDSMMIRPHPAVWRLIHGLNIMYFLFMVFLLCQSHTKALRTLNFFDHKVGVTPLVPPEYAVDCRVHTPNHPSGSNYANIMDALHSDIFLLAHFLGWVAKALFLRDWTLLWVMCILWEVVEFTFQHMLPNFHECWWDHWILDVALCNFGGMAFGMGVCKYFSMKTYNWTGTSLTTSGKFFRALAQLGPYSWTEFTWDVFSSLKRFLSLTFLLIVGTVRVLIELNAFFLMKVFWLKPSHLFNQIRLVTWFFLCTTSSREYFQYITDKRQRRLGVNVWLALALTVTELAITVKFHDGFLTLSTFPAIVVNCWTATLLLVSAWIVLKFHVFGMSARSAVVNLVLGAALLPLAYLVFAMDVGYGRMFHE